VRYFAALTDAAVLDLDEGAGLGALLQAGAGGPSFLAGTYVYGALLAFTSVQVSIVAMRWRDPARYRPFEVPVNIPVDGRQIPVLAIVGARAPKDDWIVMLTALALAVVAAAGTAL